MGSLKFLNENIEKQEGAFLYCRKWNKFDYYKWFKKHKYVDCCKSYLLKLEKRHSIKDLYSSDIKGCSELLGKSLFTIK